MGTSTNDSLEQVGPQENLFPGAVPQSVDAQALKEGIELARRSPWLMPDPFTLVNITESHLPSSSLDTSQPQMLKAHNEGVLWPLLLLFYLQLVRNASIKAL